MTTTSTSTPTPTSNWTLRQGQDKDKWIQHERIRWAKTFDVPMKEEGPANFPPPTLNVMRVLSALSIRDQGQDMLVKCLDKLYHEYWVNHQEIANPDVFGPILKGLLGQKLADEGLAEAATIGKSTLKDNTDKAFQQGAFGLPWLVCTNGSGQVEGFWGVDHIGQVLHFLGIDKPSQGAWKAVL